MEASISLQDAANIVIFVAPGYFAIQVYSLIYAKRRREFSHLLIESVVYSLPIVAVVNGVWQLCGFTVPANVSALYVIILVATAVLAGGAASFLRRHRAVHRHLQKLGLGSADEDFVKTVLLNIDNADAKHNVVIVKLKSGQVFSGTVQLMSRYSFDGPKYYYFTNIAWLDKETYKWQARPGGVLVERDEVEYLETPPLKVAA